MPKRSLQQQATPEPAARTGLGAPRFSPRALPGPVRAADPLGLLGVVLLLGLWWLLTLVVSRTALPLPQDVARRIGDDFLSAPELALYGVGQNGLLSSVVYTVENVLLAVGIGGAIGTVAGLASARIELVRSLIDPVVLTAGTIPILVTAPFFLIWFGIGRISALLLVILYVSTILYIFAQRAASNLDPVYEDAARTLGASQRRLIRDVLLPGTVPEILGGVRIALAGAWGLEAIAELLGLPNGIGKIIQVLAQQTDAEGILAAIVLLGVVAVLFDALAAFSFRRITRWARRWT
jgi:ABC-type nitrate/sulfonate/bicarbonate transport system permease component